MNKSLSVSAALHASIQIRLRSHIPLAPNRLITDSDSPGYSRERCVHFVYLHLYTICGENFMFKYWQDQSYVIVDAILKIRHIAPIAPITAPIKYDDFHESIFNCTLSQ